MLEERARLRLARPGDDKWLADLVAQLAGAEVPEATRYLLGFFYALHSERQSNGYSPSALTSIQIAAWRDLTGIQISPWEIGVLRQLDNCWLRMWSEAREEEDRKRDTSKVAKDGVRPESQTIRN